MPILKNKIKKDSQDRALNPSNRKKVYFNIGIPETTKSFIDTKFKEVRTIVKTPSFKKRYIIYAFSFAVHFSVLFGIGFSAFLEKVLKSSEKTPENIEVVDIREYVPPPIDPLEKKNEKMKIEEDDFADKSESNDQNVIKANPEGDEKGRTLASENEVVDYVSQGKIGTLPSIPEKEIKSKIIYPQLANQQGIEGVVIVELYIDKYGVLRNVGILKDPGYGFGEAAVKGIKEALKDIKCSPARDQSGNVCAVKYRYPIRFSLKK